MDDPTESRSPARLFELAEMGDWPGVVTEARQAILADPDAGVAHALLAIGLVQAGDTSDAVSAARRGVGLAPDLALAHYALGVSLVARDQAAGTDEALACFIAALQLDPTFELARLAVVESIKNRSTTYRLILGLTYWMQALRPGARWAVIIGLYLAFRAVSVTLRANPDWAPILVPLLAAYVLFVLTSWIAGPVSNLVLRLHRLGRYLLSPVETLAANVVGGCLAGAATAGLVYWATAAPAAAVLALVCLGMTVPASGAFDAHGTSAWRTASIFASALAAVGIAAIVAGFAGGMDAARPALAILLLGIVAFSWVSQLAGSRGQ